MPQPEVRAKRPPLLIAPFAAWGAILLRNGVWVCAGLLVVVVLAVHAYKYPDFSGFWAGADQHRYLESARAWAAGDRSPDKHYYLPLYGLIGAAGVWLTPWQPFMLPDLACLLICLFLFVAIGRRLVPTWRPAALAVCFVTGVLGGRVSTAIWVVPWSTTGSAPFEYLTLLLTLLFTERPTRKGAFLTGASGALVAGFRPADSALLLAICGLYSAWRLQRLQLSLRSFARLAGAAGLGLVAGLVPTGAAHCAVFGLAQSPYLHLSSAIGFEWRLLPMRWVIIMISPRPLLPDGEGIARALPWVGPGIAGMVLALIFSAKRPACVLIAVAVTLHWALYLAYRDLHPYGLWRFYNIHYFKWTFPFLVLWAAQLALALLQRRGRIWAAAVCVACAGLFVWRPALRAPLKFDVAETQGDVLLPERSLRLDHAIRLPLKGSWERLYFGPFTLKIGATIFIGNQDFKILPLQNGALLIPLRRLPDGIGILHLPPGVIGHGTAEVLKQSVAIGFR